MTAELAQHLCDVSPLLYKISSGNLVFCSTTRNAWDTRCAISHPAVLVTRKDPYTKCNVCICSVADQRKT